MVRRSLASIIAALTMCGLMFSGCGPSNESGLKGESKVAPRDPNIPDFTSYSEVSQYQMEKAREQMKKGAKKAE